MSTVLPSRSPMAMKPTIFVCAPTAVVAQPDVVHGLGIPADPKEGAPHGVQASLDVNEALKQPRSEVIPEHAIDGRTAKVVEGDNGVLEVAHHHFLAVVVLAVTFVVGAGTPVAVGPPPLAAPSLLFCSSRSRLSYRSNMRTLDSHVVPIFTPLLTTTLSYRWEGIRAESRGGRRGHSALLPTIVVPKGRGRLGRRGGGGGGRRGGRSLMAGVVFRGCGGYFFGDRSRAIIYPRELSIPTTTVAKFSSSQFIHLLTHLFWRIVLFFIV